MLPFQVTEGWTEGANRRITWRRIAGAAGLLFALAGRAGAQQVVSGTVTDAATRRPLDNAVLAIQGTRVRTTTDEQGQFRFTVPSGHVTVVVTRVGYQPVTATMQAGSTNVTVAMSAAAVSLDEVIVTGTPGAQQARALGNAVDKL
ncbi:MAG: carboxypeptidase-like regulatory domain-containing protein, partial [Gemmatimonadetes bacterium]|nr:carboxypeptidase-like regulatory domain-containing protein [Gemmatimonadota bacterium]